MSEMMPHSEGNEEEILDTRPHVLISGYYGFDNLGDELILRVLVQELKKRNARITVLSANPEKTSLEYGVNAIHRLNPLSFYLAISQSHLLISGGGGLFQDVTGPGSVLYYGGIIGLARFFEVPVCFWSQGVGPVNRPLSRSILRKALMSSKAITVRDEESARLVEELTGYFPMVTADPVWLLEVPDKTVDLAHSPTWNIGISLRPWPDLTEERLKGFAEFLRRFIAESGQPVEIFLLPFQESQDRPVLEQWVSYLGEIENVRYRLVPSGELYQTIGQCHVMFGMRFHSLILGILSNVAVFGLIYDPKVRNLLEVQGLQGVEIPAIPSLNPESVRDYFNQYRSPKLNHLKQMAAQNFEKLDEILSVEPADLA